ncbi:FecR family protein [Pedobacter xixiisoli]|uniref:FecR family protein n=1 Tax=Pedobacter xixiisoli TaxID=1476464 RepID=A0A286AEW8_9SPHI|nr:FecR family protein [Pedobacter xixiisoli]SOD20454.1 FecR family protein [Pedobacter xixiisoli]
MTGKPEILELIAMYLNNPEDLQLKSSVDDFRSQSIKNEAFFKEIEKVWLLSSQSSVLDSFDEHAAVARFQKRLSFEDKDGSKKTIKFSFLRWSAAAAVILVVASSIYFYKNTETLSGAKTHTYASDALPGSNKAVLVLANGRKVSLTDINNGDVAKEAGLSITKTADGQLVYTVSETGQTNEDDNAVNTIETPKGGMWRIKLPDGSNVWLNAASSLTYPLSFSKGQKRVVELKGEAYFEVAEDKLHPFVVKTRKQEVEVLGTHFNINSYADETAVKTTLLEGSVRVNLFSNGNRSEILKPGQQSILTEKAFDVKEVDVDEAIDWKNGYFMFNNEKQESIMRKIARWYNVQIEYADQEAKDVTYYGSISRFDNISKVLRKFEQTGEVRFEIIKNKVIVFKEKNAN